MWWQVCSSSGCCGFRAWPGTQPLEPVRFRDSPAGQSPLRREGVLQIFTYSPHHANWKGAAGVCGCWSEGGSVSPLYFHPGLVPPPSPSVSLRISAYLRCKKQQFHGFGLEEAQMLAHLWLCENTPVFLQKSVGDVLVGGDFSCCLFLLLVVEGQCSISSLFYLCYLAGGSDRALQAQKAKQHLESLLEITVKWCLEVAMSVYKRRYLKPSSFSVLALVKTCRVIIARMC